MHYTVAPGLYALGSPDKNSPVLVTANYKMSFDKLREALPDRNLWILVLDTKGVNVWCSAGKGTFGTIELVSRIKLSGLERIVSHRELILPQLAAPGVSAHEVNRLSGFKVIYGPIRAIDLPQFLDNGFKATQEMRLKTFTLWERIVLIPIEFFSALKGGIVVVALFFFLSYFMNWGNWGEVAQKVFPKGLFSALAILSAILSGAVFTPILLPWLPGRAFSIKGALIGFIPAVLFLIFRWKEGIPLERSLEMFAWLFLIPSISAFLAMNFTGASTYTSLSGVKKEMRWALPFQVAGGMVGLGFWLTSNFIS